jgi:DNA polymerase-1
MINKTLKDKDPKRLAVVFDAKGPTFRHELFHEYKANRPAMPDELAEQISMIHDLIQAYSLPSLSKTGFEADDIVATLVKEAGKRSWKVVIVSGDKDLMQLVGDNVIMWDPQADKEYTPAEVEKKFGVGPDKLLDLLAMVGDTSDNVPGVPGVGLKTASSLLKEYESLDEILESADEITPARARNSLVKNRDTALLSRDLIQLRDDVPLDLELEDLVRGDSSVGELERIYQELEFNKLLSELPRTTRLDYSGYSLITGEKELESLIARLREAGSFAVDLETTSERPVWAELVGISFSCEEGVAFYIPVGHEKGDQLDKRRTLELLKPLLEDSSIEKIGQNIKYDIIVLKKEGIELRPLGCDTMIASYLLDSGRRGHSLDDLAQIHLNHKMIPITDLIGTGKSQISFDKTPIEQAMTYSCEDADVTFRVSNKLRPRLTQEGLSELFYEIETPLIPILADMELTGVKVDPFKLKSLSEEFSAILNSTREQIYDLAGENFNINSPKQLASILFERIGLKPVKKTKTGPSTSLDVLEKLALEHSLPQKILDYRSIFKLKSTYVDALSELVNRRTGRIHTSYNQAVAATGRLSSSDPNLQNIPIRSEEGRKIRQAFVPEKDHLFVAADYSQIELRVMAHLSDDERLKEAFANNEDIHAITAASVFGVSTAHVTPDMRRKAKEINFGIIYGMGSYKLAGQIGVGMKMAEKYLQDYYNTYSGVKDYMDRVPRLAAEKGYVTTLMGRRRLLPDINSSNKITRQAAARVAINTTIQGAAADIMKKAMIGVHKRTMDYGPEMRMILQVHDELILEVKDGLGEEASQLLREEMENAVKLTVPLAVETAIGENWDEAH